MKRFTEMPVAEPALSFVKIAMRNVPEKLPAKIGRKTKYKDEFSEQAAHLCRLGATEEDLAKFFKVDVATVGRWKVKTPSFRIAVRNAKASADKKVEDALFNRATGASVPDTHFSAYEGVVTATPHVKHYPPDPTSMMFWLRNRDPSRWGGAEQTCQQLVNLNITFPNLKPAVSDTVAGQAIAHSPERVIELLPSDSVAEGQQLSAPAAQREEIIW